MLTAILTAARIAFVPLTEARAPYAFVFVAVIASAVLAGWRSGLVALLLGQVLAWFFIAPPQWSFAAKSAEELAALSLATFSQMIALAIIAFYQWEIDRTSAARESQMSLLSKALKEIDHRTSNNYQTVLALVLAQAKIAEPPVKEALQQVADRIRAIASASRKLAVASESLKQVRVADHLQDLCDQIERGLSRTNVQINCSFEDISLGADETVCTSILVNELVTNALKHAFPDNRAGTVKVTLKRAGRAVELGVEDNGVGMNSTAPGRGAGLGSRLVETFVKQLRAKHEVASDHRGTRHRIQITG